MTNKLASGRAETRYAKSGLQRNVRETSAFTLIELLPEPAQLAFPRLFQLCRKGPVIRLNCCGECWLAANVKAKKFPFTVRVN